MKVVWSPEAITDLEDIFAYVAAANPAAANRLLTRIIDATERLLSNHQAAGRPGKLPQSRELVVPGTPYVIPYRIESNEVLISRVVHGARSWPRQF